MKKTLLLLFILSSYASFSQKNDTLRKYFDASFQPTSKSKAAIAGLAIRSGDHWYLIAVYPNNKPILKAYFKDPNLEVKDGPYSVYYENGNKASEGNFINNSRQGVWKFYYQSGGMKDSGMVINDQMTGSWSSWYENGGLKFEAGFPDPDSIYASSKPLIVKEILHNSLPAFSLHGGWTSYFPNGKIDSKGSYVYNLKEGKWNYYHENGNLSTIEVYKSDKVTAMECFDSTGTKTGDFCSIAKAPYPNLDRFTDFNTYMLDNIFWPKELLDKNVSGMVKGRYTITKLGEFKDFVITDSPHELLSKETERFFRSLKQWSPAVSHNRAIDFTVSFEIPFVK
ncbi:MULTISPECIES: energy transducer TonB [unclassified Paraflavitalea]|uniref:energy transducer TonB n=1 Tax=unclassified Paraflavitalea TaxID=2798305 RepID=UPI003D353011